MKIKNHELTTTSAKQLCVFFYYWVRLKIWSDSKIRDVMKWSYASCYVGPTYRTERPRVTDHAGLSSRTIMHPPHSAGVVSSVVLLCGRQILKQ